MPVYKTSKRPRRRRLALSLVLLLPACILLAASAASQVQHVHVQVRRTTTVLFSSSRGLRTTQFDQQQPLQGFSDRLPSCRGPKQGMSVPHLVPQQQWKSSKPRQQESVTVVTQLSLERLGMLENQCLVWPDPIAAAVYVPTVGGRVASQDAALNSTTLEGALGLLAAFHQRMEQEGACVLDLELNQEDFETEELETNLYPINAIRNRALMLAQTEALLLLDVDFVPTPTMVPTYKSPEGYARLMQQLNSRQAIVIPAFQTASKGAEGKQLALDAATSGKAFVVEQYRSGNLDGFQIKRYARGHTPTNFERWASEDVDYKIKHKEGFEPYVLVSHSWLPWYDERFRGYGKDKIQHMLHMQRGLHVTLHVHPTGYVVHVPHPNSPTHAATRGSGQWDKLSEMYVQVQKEIKKKRYVPVVSFPELCKQRQ